MLVIRTLFAQELNRSFELLWIGRAAITHRRARCRWSG
jgi:hypothetical protein